MKFVELKTKDHTELERMLHEARDELREARFRVHRGNEKNVRRVRHLRRLVAQLLTLLGG